VTGATGNLPYFDQQFKLPAVKLFPGDYIATQTPKLLVTLLGSCVSVCMRDPVNGVCGMNHFLLPEQGGVLAPDLVSARFGVQAMELMITSMQKMGAQRRRLQAKAFGAGSVLDGMTVVNVGDMNAAFVLRYLETEGISLLASDLKGTCARKVYFFTDTGKVMIRRLGTERVSSVVQRESQYMESLQQNAPQDGAIDLFD
jgi:chemotaxis protein CheD